MAEKSTDASDAVFRADEHREIGKGIANPSRGHGGRQVPAARHADRDNNESLKRNRQHGKEQASRQPGRDSIARWSPETPITNFFGQPCPDPAAPAVPWMPDGAVERPALAPQQEP